MNAKNLLTINFLSKIVQKRLFCFKKSVKVNLEGLKVRLPLYNVYVSALLEILTAVCTICTKIFKKCAKYTVILL